MLTFEWNALRIGDHVVVHDPQHPELPLLAGTVSVIQATRTSREVNGLGIRVATVGGGHRVIWPSYLAAHLESSGPAEDCWQCTALANSASR